MTEHAHPQNEELKKHGDELEHALKPASGHNQVTAKSDPATSKATSQKKE